MRIETDGSASDRSHDTQTMMDRVPAASALLPLHVWLSPAFPVGGFAYSHGIETAVDEDDITDAESLQGWIEDLLAHGSLRNDAILLANAYRFVHEGAWPQAITVNELALALCGSKERHLETISQGNAFLLAVRAAWPSADLERLAELAPDGVAYPVALAVAAAAHRQPLVATIEAYLLGFVANLTSAAVRLGPIGQTDGQRVIARLVPLLTLSAGKAAQASLDDLGGAALRSDVASMRHETLYSRLFRS